MTTIRTSLAHHVEQGLYLSPTFLRALEVLQLDASTLVAEIEAECVRNEMLRVVPRRNDLVGDPERRAAALEAAEDRPIDLLAHVRREVALLDVVEELRGKVLALAEHLDERGYLDGDRMRLAQIVGESALDGALDVLHELPPRGLGARDAVDAMLLQVDAKDPDRPAIEQILRRHLDALAGGRRDEVAQALDVDRDELDALITRIRSLDPAPGRRFATPHRAPVRPDLAVSVEGGRIVVTVGDGALPELAIDRRIADLVGARELPRERRRELAGKLRAARSLMRAVSQRQETLQRVGAAVFATQREFLRSGRSHVRRLRMGELAESLGLHASTVSRAVAGKTVWTPHGLILLREFFEDAGRGPTRAERDALVAALKELLTTPCRRTDAELAVELAGRGLTVARRTVAKYRSLLGATRSQRESSASESCS